MDVTIKDVARAAGVSASTVSRVLAGNSAISPPTQEKVRQVLREMNYHPHAGARSLVTGSSKTIGLVTSRPAAETFANPFFPEVIRGIGSVLDGEGYNLLLSTVQGDRNQDEACLNMLRSRHVDGVILTRSVLGDRLIDALVAEKRSFVLIGRPADRQGGLSHPSVPFVNNDNVSAAAVATEHLIERGHRRIAFVSGQRDRVYCFDRLQGYRTALEEAGIAFDPALVSEENVTQQDGAGAMELLLRLRQPPTAILAVDDMLALGIVEAATKRGLRVPADLAVAGFNDSPIAYWTRPSLTTVRIPVFDLGAMAARMMVASLHGIPFRPHQLILPSQIIPRESTNGI
ncbi:MAG TPA: LacI family DNA-binding transcriptional regulator [Symbiobacteriaceae bacterium]|jgi:DNA-binding LacI/PurR family transcriptional regulator|nr:LacI family DNA-binding transcriptional regulator [Symbiobacteriaceae bacterium]